MTNSISWSNVERTFTNVPVHYGKESNQPVPLKDRILEALNKNVYYMNKGTTELEAIADKLTAKVNKLEAGEWNYDDVIGFSINNDGSIAIRYAEVKTYLQYRDNPSDPFPDPPAPRPPRTIILAPDTFDEIQHTAQLSKSYSTKSKQIDTHIDWPEESNVKFDPAKFNEQLNEIFKILRIYNSKEKEIDSSKKN